MIDPELITGLVLAGGRGSRMGGVDKGLQNHHGIPLALHALLRLQPQVGHLMLNANRNLGAYEAFGAPVWPDATADFPGPLAGVLAGLDWADVNNLFERDEHERADWDDRRRRAGGHDDGRGGGDVGFDVSGID